MISEEINNSTKKKTINSLRNKSFGNLRGNFFQRAYAKLKVSKSMNFDQSSNNKNLEYRKIMMNSLHNYEKKFKFNERIVEETEENLRPLKKEMKKFKKLRNNFLIRLLKTGLDYRF